MEVQGICVLLVFGPVKNELHGEHLRGFKTWINRKQVVQAAEHQAGAHQQDEREDDLKCYQGGANTCTTRTPGGSFTAITERSEWCAGGDDSWDGCEKQSRKQCASNAKQKYSAIKANISRQRREASSIRNKELRSS